MSKRKLITIVKQVFTFDKGDIPILMVFAFIIGWTIGLIMGVKWTL